MGDRVLICLSKSNERTQTGLFLPPGIHEKEKVQQGYFIKVGLGYAIPNTIENELWKNEEEQIKYIPLHVRKVILRYFAMWRNRNNV